MNVVVDKYSNCIFVRGLKTKDQSVEHLIYLVRQECGSKTKVIRTDQGEEYMGISMGKFCNQIGAKQEISNTGNSPQNGTAKKAIQGIMNSVRTILDDSGICGQIRGIYKEQIPVYIKRRHEFPVLYEIR